MGALHSGHRALLDAARDRADSVVVSIFVNPLQFGPHEDLEKYPRPFEDDLAMCREAGVDFVFAPGVEEMYPDGPEVSVTAGRMGRVFEGAARPGHFDGVLTVVAKLFHLARPDLATFGLKDIQQYCLVARMVADLDFTVELLGVPIVRDTDGLALSSRNTYLTPAERDRALALPRILSAAEDAADPVSALEAGRRVAAETTDVEVDYLAVVEEVSFRECGAEFRGRAVILVAAKVGDTRLIDNRPVEYRVTGS